MVRKRTYLAALTLAAATAGVAAPAQAGPAQDVKLVTAGYEHRCLVTTGGDAYCWGWNAYGQLGDGTTRDRATPVKVVGLGGKATAIVAGQTNTCAIIEGGAVKCWGSNSFGELGNGTHTPSTVPVQVKGLISGWAGIGLGWSTTCARNSSGMVKCWGDNSFGQLGTGSSAYESLVPVTVHEMSSGVARFGIGAFTGCGLSAGALRCWGSNDAGPLRRLPRY